MVSAICPACQHAWSEHRLKDDGTYLCVTSGNTGDLVSDYVSGRYDYISNAYTTCNCTAVPPPAEPEPFGGSKEN